MWSWCKFYLVRSLAWQQGFKHYMSYTFLLCMNCMVKKEWINKTLYHIYSISIFATSLWIFHKIIILFIWFLNQILPIQMCFLFYFFFFYVVYFNPFGLFWFNSVNYVHFGPIRSTLILFGPLGSIQSTLLLFGPLRSYSVYSVYIGSIQSILFYSVHLALIRSTSVLFDLFCQLWS